MRSLAALLVAAALLASCGTPPRGAPSSPPAAPDGDAIAVGPDWVRPLAGGPPTFAAVAAAIDRASQRIEVEMYEFQRADLADRLAAAHGRGVRVLLIADAHAAGSAASLQRLRAAGVTAIDYPADRRTIDHVKLLLVDGSLAIVGGINWGLASEKHRDFAAEVRGPVVANLERVFQSDLAATGRPAALPPPVPDPGIQVLTTHPARAIEAAVLSAVAAAVRRIDLELFALTAPAAVEALSAAHRRGVEVRVLLDPHQDTLNVRETLRHAGVPAAYYPGPGKLHAKIVVVDGQRVIFGSANWTNSGFGTNHELDLEIRSPPVAAAFQRALAEDWRAVSLTGPQIIPGHQAGNRDSQEAEECRRHIA